MKQLALTAGLAVVLLTPAVAQERLYIDAGTRGHDINPSMYGIFFEEINHAGDGGLYAELIQNRGFEEHVIPGGFEAAGTGKIKTPTFTRYTDLSLNQLNWNWDYEGKKMLGWSVVPQGCRETHSVETPAQPLHSATPNALVVVTEATSDGGKVQVVNNGYWGMAVEKGKALDLRFHLSTADIKGKVRAMVMDGARKSTLAAVEFDIEADGTWHEYKGVLTPSETATDACFVLEWSGNGTMTADWVSLFPQDTYMNRPNGMRPDIAGMLADMKPKFMRWPGGCIVEGIVLDNRVKWKETIGDPMTRPGEYDLWGYRSTWGMGYHEVLQFCEDLGMDCMFVGNAGLSCIGWGGEYVSGDDVEPYYIDIRDAIEYAIGDPAANEWAAKRAEAGHPAPFPLKYVEIGNENFGPRYDANYKYIYQRLKAEYPQLTFLNTMGIDHAEQYGVRTDMIDPHWYVSPDFFYTNRTIFDDTPRGHYGIYVGEFAANGGVGQGNVDAALAEAVFMMDMERNSDLVKMASYAPLITNDHAPNWTCNLIWQHSGEVFGRASYYTQKVFAENVPDYNIGTELRTSAAGMPYDGRAGVGTWQTDAEFRGFRVTASDGTVLYTADYAGNLDEWTPMQGDWSAAGGSYRQATRQDRCLSFMNRLALRDCTIEVEALKHSGNEGFLLAFGAEDYGWDRYLQFNVGGWNNTGAAFENVTRGTGAIISERPAFKIENDRWYALKVVCRDGRIEGYIDGELVCSHTFGTIPVGRVAAHAGYDAKSGEIVVKVVNATADELPLTLDINAKDIKGTATAVTMAAESLWDENSFARPQGTAPVVTEVRGVAPEWPYTFSPNSLTVLRIPAAPAAEARPAPASGRDNTPRTLSPDPVESGAAATLRRLVEEARAIAFDDVEGSGALLAEAASAQNVLKGGDPEAMQLSASALTAAINAYCRALMTDGADLTHLLVNPHFETSGDASGWSGNLVVGSHVAEVFNSNFSVSQTVGGLEPGHYLVYAQAYYRYGGQEAAHAAHADGSEKLNATFTVNSASKPVVSVMGEVHDGYWWGAPNTMGEAHDLFGRSGENFANYIIAPAEEGELRISFDKSSTRDADWFCMDNVRLYRVPTADTSVTTIEDARDAFSPRAAVCDLGGRTLCTLAEAPSLAPGTYVVSERGQSAKFIKRQ